MKKEINPAMAGIVIAVIVLVVGVLIWHRSNSDVVSGPSDAAKVKASKADK